MIKVNYCIADEGNYINDLLALPVEKLDYPVNPRTKLCPALQSNLDWYVIKSTHTYHLRHEFNVQHESIVNIQEHNSFTDEVFDKLIHIHPKSKRNSPSVPTIQFLLKHIFFTKEKDVDIEIFPAFMNHELNKQPLVSVHGKYPISNWVRPINFAFDWVDPSQDIHIKRGSDLVYVRFTKNAKLEKVPFTEEIKKIADTCSVSPDYHTRDWKFIFKHARQVLKLG